MKITMYELLGLVKDGKAPEKIRFDRTYWYRRNGVKNVYYYDENDERDLFIYLLRHCLSFTLNDEVEILDEIEEKEEKKIPEKINISNFPRHNNSLKKTAIKVNEIIDYLKSKGDE